MTRVRTFYTTDNGKRVKIAMTLHSTHSTKSAAKRTADGIRNRGKYGVSAARVVKYGPKWQVWYDAYWVRGR